MGEREDMEQAAKNTGTKLIEIPGVGWAFLGAKGRIPSQEEVEAVEELGEILGAAIEVFKRAVAEEAETAGSQLARAIDAEIMRSNVISETKLFVDWRK